MSRPRQIEVLRQGLRPPWPRPDVPHIAIAGRSNVGKSSLLNALLKRKKLAGVGKNPGKTRSLHSYLIDNTFVLCDLPGYGYAKVPKTLRARWGAAIQEYLQAPMVRGVVCLIDGRHPPTTLDLQMVETLEHLELPWLPVLTKADKVPRGKRGKHTTTAGHELRIAPDQLIWTSATTGEGLGELYRTIRELAEAD